MVPSMLGGGGYYWIRLAREPAHVLFVASDGRRIHQRDSGSRGSQNYNDGSSL